MPKRSVEFGPLPYKSHGRKGPPVVLLHGFGFDGASWEPFAAALSGARRTVAFDLPGHGEAAGFSPTPGAAAAAKAVIASLDAMKIARAAFVGHSLGGAVAALVGLMRPDLVERMILLAPGGFGPQMNTRLLRRYAAAADVATLAPLVEAFFAPASPVPAGLVERLAAARGNAALRASLAAIIEKIADGDGQGTLPLATLAEAPFPTSLVWGLADNVLPAAQAISAPPAFARHLLPDVGHMPQFEAPQLVEAIVRRTLLGRAEA